MIGFPESESPMLVLGVNKLCPDMIPASATAANMKKTTTPKTNRSLTRTSRLMIATAYHGHRREVQQYRLNTDLCIEMWPLSLRLLLLRIYSFFSQNHLSATIYLLPTSYNK